MHSNESSHIETLTQIKNGQVILCPTDTLWGLSCDAFNEEAVAHIYKIKKRDRDKPLILLVSSVEMLKAYVPHIHPRIETLLFYHMRPLSVIYNNPINLPKWLVAQNNSIAIRLVLDSFIKTVISDLGRPIASTSANVQGQPTADDYESITADIKSEVDYIVPIKQANKVERSASVIIRYDDKGEIELVR